MKVILEGYGESIALILFGSGLLAIWQYIGAIMI